MQLFQKPDCLTFPYQFRHPAFFIVQVAKTERSGNAETDTKWSRLGILTRPQPLLQPGIDNRAAKSAFCARPDPVGVGSFLFVPLERLFSMDSIFGAEKARPIRAAHDAGAASHAKVFSYLHDSIRAAMRCPGWACVLAW
jgi:hypothetical protein